MRARDQWREILRVRPGQPGSPRPRREKQILEDAPFCQVQHRGDSSPGRPRAGFFPQYQTPDGPKIKKKGRAFTRPFQHILRGEQQSKDTRCCAADMRETSHTRPGHCVFASLTRHHLTPSPLPCQSPVLVTHSMRVRPPACAARAMENP